MRPIFEYGVGRIPTEYFVYVVLLILILLGSK